MLTSLLLCSIGVLSFSPRLALAHTGGNHLRADYAPIGVIQATPGVHLTLSGGKIGIGASVDLLGGVVLNGNRIFSVTPGVVVGPFAEVNAVLNQGVSYAYGARVGAGALAPTLFGGYLPFGMLTYDIGESRGAVTGKRRGLHARALFFGAAASQVGGEDWVVTGGVELPLLPAPAVE
jgi:hypothetical protein